MSILTLIRGTIRELLSKATLYVLLGISTLVLLGTLVAISAQQTNEGIVLHLFGLPISTPAQPEELMPSVYNMQAGLARGLFVGIMLFGVFATASLIPDSLEKGIVDLYLSKPLARWELLAGRSLGGVCAIGAVTVYFIAGVWLTFGIRAGVWNVHFLLSSITMTLMFAVIGSMLAVLGVIFRNAAVPIIGCFLYLMVVDNLLDSRQTVLYMLSENPLYRTACDVFSYALPQVSSMQRELSNQILQRPVAWQAFLQPILSAFGLFGVAAFIMHRKDF
ncbi:MAG: hypothetical protein C4326_08315 [Ignavibacteria bacterium]